jgi:hypothetical protein
VARRSIRTGIVASAGGGAGAFVPDDFAFTDQTDVEQNVTATSAGVQITSSVPGGPCAISISGGEYQTADDSGFTTNASAWSSSAGTIAEDQYVRVRHTTATNWLTGGSCTLTIGEPGQTQDDTFNTTTRAAADVFLTSPSPTGWTPPGGAPTWYPGNNFIEVLGGGAPGGDRSPVAQGPGGGGGGGGGYARKNNHTLSAPESFAVGGVGGESWFNAPTTVRATGGSTGGGGAPGPGLGGAGGAGSAGDVTTTGGAGGNAGGARSGGGGGGGAAGEGGNGGAGGVSSPGPAPANGGGGGGGGGSAGTSGAGGIGTNGSGTTGGGGGTAGTGNGATGGAGGNQTVAGTPGNAGLAFGPAHGSGSGGGGNGGGSNASPGGSGGNYGGGGGGKGAANTGPIGAGAPGIIHIRY